MNNLRRENNIPFRNKKREYVIEKYISLKQTVRIKISEIYIGA
jgi:hypothetical protein